MEMNDYFIQQSYKVIFRIYFLDSVSHSWGVPTMKFTDLSILCKVENLKNRQCIKYLFAPLYIINIHSAHTILCEPKHLFWMLLIVWQH